ncbi:MAG: RNA 2',3'-cyclic phosphodiesterase [Acidimicrobiia bacterium]
MARLFVAAWPDEAVLAALDGLERPDDPSLRWVPRRQLHVTLRFLGDVAENAIDEVSSALARVDASSVVASVGPRAGRLGRSIWCVPVEGLAATAAAVNDATIAFGQSPDPRPFFGHITLARMKGRPACGLDDRRVNVTWRVGVLHLVRSLTLPSGASYETLAEVELR